MDVRSCGTTSPIYVTLGGAPVRSADDARYFGRWRDEVSKSAAAHPGYHTDAERTAVAKMLADARDLREVLERAHPRERARA
jgi:hypothetical protein